MTKEIIIYGKHPVLSILKTKRVLKVFTSNINDLKKVSDFKNLEYKSNNDLNRMFPGFNHQGYVAFVKEKKFVDLDYFIKNIEDKNNLPKLLILDQLTDVHNIGAIIRTAVAFSIKNIIVTKYNSPKDLSIISKTSAGFSEFIDLIEVINLNNTIDILKKLGYFIIGMAGEAKNDLKFISDNRNLCLIIGNEGNGIRHLVKKKCDALYRINIDNNVESLNASVAAAIAIYKLWG